jgi:capsular polysaccharide biosynthesis protein
MGDDGALNERSEKGKPLLELILLVRALTRRWGLVALPTLIVSALTLPDLLARPSGGGYTVTIDYSAAPVYDAIPRTEGDYQDLWISSEYTVNAFTDWVRGSRFRDEVIEAANARGAAIPGGALSIAADNVKSIGRVTFGWTDAAALNLIAEAVIEVLQTRSHLYFAQLGGQPAVVTILNRTEPTPAPPPIADRFSPLIRIGLGAGAGIGLALLAFYLDPAVRRREDVEALGLSVIGTIPK